MDKIEYINNLITKNNGIITSSQLSEKNIPRQYLKLMLQKKLIVKVSRGIYIKNGSLEDELYIYQQRYAKGIYSHETALYIHQFTDRMLDRYIMTFPQGYHIKPDTNDLIIKQANSKIYNLGLEEKKTNYGNTVRVYNIERTLCDIVRGRNIVDKQLFIPPIKKYLSQDKKHLFRLIEYATELRVKNKIVNYLQVLL